MHELEKPTTKENRKYSFFYRTTQMALFNDDLNDINNTLLLQ